MFFTPFTPIRASSYRQVDRPDDPTHVLKRSSRLNNFRIRLGLPNPLRPLRKSARTMTTIPRLAREACRLSDLELAAKSVALCGHADLLWGHEPQAAALTKNWRRRLNSPQWSPSGQLRLHVEVTHRFPPPNRYGWEIHPLPDYRSESSKFDFASWEEASQAGRLALRHLSQVHNQTQWACFPPVLTALDASRRNWTPELFGFLPTKHVLTDADYPRRSGRWQRQKRAPALGPRRRVEYLPATALGLPTSAYRARPSRRLARLP